MLSITRVTPRDLPDLLRMTEKLCAYHGDICVMGYADAQRRFCGDGSLVGLIAKTSGTAVGYAVLEPHWRPMHQGDLLDIAHLFVEERHRAGGVGKALIAAARDYARDVGACRLVIGTSPLNSNAATIYRAMGLDEITVQPGPRFIVPLSDT